ncbi:MAG: hypothetical protein ACKV2Q_26180 [Planctomycetaceae bacterium]
MGLFSWLFRKPAFEQLPDRIFLTRSAMLGNFVNHSQAALQTYDRVLLVTHFEKSRREILEEFKAAQTSVEDNFVRLRSHAVSSQLRSGILTLSLADQCSVEDILVESHDKSLRVALLVAERHPLRRHDERIEQFAAAMPATASLTYFASLEDAVAKRFAGAWVSDTLVNLGMQPDECIESPMVTRRLIAAQRKLESAMISDTPADSAEEWCERNLSKS